MAAALRDGRVEARIEEFGEGTPTAADAANAAGAPIDQIVKSLVFACDGRAIVVMVPGRPPGRHDEGGGRAGCERVKPVGADVVERSPASRRAASRRSRFPGSRPS